MIAPLLILVGVGMVFVRVGWSGSRRVAWLGWALVVLALLSLTYRAGAWGLATGVVVSISVALACVLIAACTARARTRRPVREAPAITLPRHPRDIARRLGVFVLSVPAAFAAAQWLAFGAQAALRRGAALDADAVVLMLLLQPMLWAAIMTIQMTRQRAAQMIAAPAAAALLGTILWGTA